MNIIQRYGGDMKFTIEITDDEDNFHWKVQAYVQAIPMKLAIESYYNEVLRNYHKYIELEPKQVELLEEITNKLRTHFGEFCD